MELRLFVRQLDQLAATIRSPVSAIGDQHEGATSAAQGQGVDHKAHTNRTAFWADPGRSFRRVHEPSATRPTRCPGLAGLRRTSEPEIGADIGQSPRWKEDRVDVHRRRRDTPAGQD